MEQLHIIQSEKKHHPSCFVRGQLSVRMFFTFIPENHGLTTIDSLQSLFQPLTRRFMEQIVVNNVHYKKDKKEKRKENVCYVTYQEKRLTKKITSNDNIYVI